MAPEPLRNPWNPVKNGDLCMKKNKNLFVFLLSILCIVIVWGVSKYARKSYMRDADKAGRARLNLSAEQLSPKPIVYLESYPDRPYERKPKSWQPYCYTNPFFVLYDNGLVIYKKNRGDCKFFSVELSPEGLNAFLKEINPDDEFFKLDSDYDTFLADLYAEIGDQIDGGSWPFCRIRLWHGNTMKQVRILGSIEVYEMRSKVPDAFLKIADRLYSFDHPDAHLWQPEKIMVSAWPTNVPDDNLVLWPYDWPDLYDEATKEFKDSDGNYYFIHMSGDKLSELDRLLSSLDGNSAILINGKEFFVKVSHYCLPAEELFEGI